MGGGEEFLFGIFIFSYGESTHTQIFLRHFKITIFGQLLTVYETSSAYYNKQQVLKSKCNDGLARAKHVIQCNGFI